MRQGDGAERPSRRKRKKWPWWHRILYWFYGFFVGPFLTKHDDGTITGAMTRWAVAAFTVAMYIRMTSDPGKSLGWADAFAIFVILFALPIDGAMTRLAKRDPGRVLDAVTGMFGRGSERGGSYSSWSGFSHTSDGPPSTPPKPPQEIEP